MGVIYTTGWTRELTRNDGYLEWYESLPNRAEVCLQQFQPPQKVLGFPFETWSFEIGILCGEGERRSFSPRFGTDPSPLIMHGDAFYYDGVTEWGEVFPARIVPNSRDLGINQEQQYRSIGHMAVYEPEYLGCYRVVVLVPHGAGFHTNAMDVERNFRRSYRVNCDDGCLIYAFVQSHDHEKATKVSGYLYSQWIERD